jgi:hypothetical protein
MIWISLVAAIASAGTLLVLAAAAIIAYLQVRSSEEIRVQQARPYVTVYFELNPASRTIVDLTIKNVGLTAATDVSIEFTPQLESVLGTRSGYPASDWSPLKTGVSILPPGQKLTTVFDSLVEAKAATLHSWEVSITYYGSAVSRRFEDTYTIDRNTFGTGLYIDETSLKDVVKSLDGLSKALQHPQPPGRVPVQDWSALLSPGPSSESERPAVEDRGSFD